MIWLRSIVSFVSARATYFIVIALAGAIAAHFVQINVLKIQIGHRDIDIRQLEMRVEALTGVNAWNDQVISSMNVVAQENRERLHLAEVRAEQVEADLIISHEKIIHDARESDRRLQDAYNNNQEWAFTVVPADVWGEVL